MVSHDRCLPHSAVTVAGNSLELSESSAMRSCSAVRHGVYDC